MIGLKNITVLTFSLLFFSSVLAIEAKINFEKDCVGMWLFDEGSGKVAKDSSGNKNHGSLKGNAKWGKGKFGNALQLKGAVSDYVEVKDSDSLDMEEQTTIMFWVSTSKKMNEAARWDDRQVVVGKHFMEYEVGIYDTGFLHTYTSDLAVGYDEGIMATMGGVAGLDPDWKKNKWYHVAWTLDGKDEVAYVNGIKIGDHVKNNKGTQPGNHPLEFGRRVEGGLPLTGAIDEIAIFSVVLDENDIKTVATRGLKQAFAVSPKSKLTTTWSAIKQRDNP